jgi:hypothetical protein
MKFSRFISVYVVGLAVLALVAGGVFNWNETTNTGALALQAPAFVQAAEAAPEEGETADVPQTLLEEAGMAAYFQTDLTVRINDNLRDAFRVIEDETDDYIIGLVQLEGFSESHDVHVYVHTDGWLLAYYPREDAVGKTLDIAQYDGTRAIPNKLSYALGIVASAAGVASPPPTFYHFQYPNANRMTIIGETTAEENWFNITLPSDLVYFDFSYAFHSTGGNTLYLNGDGIASTERAQVWGRISAALLPTDQEHQFDVRWDNNFRYAIIIIYREP